MPDLSFVRGDSQAININFKINNEPLNISGSTIWFTVKNNIVDSDENSILQKTTDNTGIVFMNALTGSAQVILTTGDTANLSPQLYVYDTQILISGNLKTPLQGKITVTEDVTRST